MVEIYLKDMFNENLRTLNEKVFIFIDESQIDKNGQRLEKSSMTNHIIYSSYLQVHQHSIWNKMMILQEECVKNQ